MQFFNTSVRSFFPFFSFTNGYRSLIFGNLPFVYIMLVPISNKCIVQLLPLKIAWSKPVQHAVFMYCIHSYCSVWTTFCKFDPDKITMHWNLTLSSTFRSVFLWFWKHLENACIASLSNFFTCSFSKSTWKKNN